MDPADVVVVDSVVDEVVVGSNMLFIAHSNSFWAVSSWLGTPRGSDSLHPWITMVIHPMHGIRNMNLMETEQRWSVQKSAIW
jgi:hypothetical protein